MTAKPPKLSKSQQDLMDEIAAAGTLYVRRYGPFYRTVEALERRDLIFRSEPDYSRLSNDGWSIKVVEAPSPAPVAPPKAPRAVKATETVPAPPNAPQGPRAASKALPKPGDLNGLLRFKLERALKAQGRGLDTYDPDFIIGFVREFLGENDAVLTGTGVKRFRRNR